MNIIFNNLLSFPLLSLLAGIGINTVYPTTSITSVKFNKLLILFILLIIGMKGGLNVFDQIAAVSFQLILLMSALVCWGLFQPLLGFYLLRKWTQLDVPTAAAAAACFGSVSAMTFVAASSYLDESGEPFQGIVVAIMAIMEVPAIFSGLLLAKSFGNQPELGKHNHRAVIKEALGNKSIVLIALGMIFGIFLKCLNALWLENLILLLFKPALCLFLCEMGATISRFRSGFKTISLPLTLFGIYMPLIGCVVGLLLGYLFALDVGTTTMVMVITASASYIAVPGAMKLALPQANEAVYMPLTIGIAFPFNLLIGIPFYYQIALVSLHPT